MSGLKYIHSIFSASVMATMVGASTVCIAGDVVFVSDQDTADRQQGTAASPVKPAQFQAGVAMNPVAPGDRGNGEQAIVDARINSLFGTVDDLQGLTGERRNRATSPAVDVVFGGQATGRQTNDAGDLLKQARSTHGVATQNRSPMVSETRVRGQRVGQVLASGSYWAPARQDLDTMLNKIDSRLVQDMVLVKGPYSHRYGPGFRFVDIEFVQTPRYENGRETHGSSSFLFETNGEQWYGRQAFWGGDHDSGFMVSYGHRTGNDYRTGRDGSVVIEETSADVIDFPGGFTLPSSYKSRDLFVAWGKDLSASETIEINILRLDQTDVEFPGLVFDLDFLVTDGYELTYVNENPDFADRFTAEFWYNRTRFEGDNLRDGKSVQQPFLIDDIGFAITDGDALSGGYRLETTHELGHGDRLSFGTDLIILNQELNDFESFNLSTVDNFPIPRSHSVDVGYYAESVRQFGPWVTVTAGVRGDVVATNAANEVEGVGSTISDDLDSELQQTFLLGSAYLTADIELNDELTGSLGAGYAQRAPTLTEMYSDGPFIGSLQRGRTFLVGDPQLDKEQLIQIDCGVRGDYGDFRGGVYGYYSWVFDYITYDLFAPGGSGAFGFPQGVALVNTDLATLTGAEMYGQYGLSKYVSAFGTFSYVRGTDRTRTGASRIFGGGSTSRSGEATPTVEALPGINPMETRLGFLIQDPSPRQRWGVEFAARVVNDQSRFAATLEEIATPGFTTYDIRTYFRKGDWLLTSGFENLTDKFYREHIDYRSGRGVFRPGFSFYTGMEVQY